MSIGFGTRLPITAAEARLLLVHRLEIAQRCIAAHWPPWKTASAAARGVLSEMAYQIGCEGTLEFHTMLAALARHDYPAAHAAGLRSDWARQTPQRARRVLGRLLVK